MATINEIKQELKDARGEHKEAKENLKRWKEDWEERLKNLKRKRVKEDYKGEKDELDGEKDLLVKNKEKWEEQVIKLQNKLADFKEEKGVSQGITQLIPPEPDVIFKEFLESEHGQFLKTYIKNNDSLPLHDSPITLKTPVPATSNGDRPCLLLYDLPGGNSKSNPITQVPSIQLTMKNAKNNLLVLLGTSGCGKTRTCYELLQSDLSKCTPSGPSKRVHLERACINGKYTF